MAHSILRGTLLDSEIEVAGGYWVGEGDEAEWTNANIITVWEIGGVSVATWLSKLEPREARTIAILSGDALRETLKGDIWAYEYDHGYSEVTPGTSEGLNVGSHDLADYFERIGSGNEVVLIVLDPAEQGDISELLASLGGKAS